MARTKQAARKSTGGNAGRKTKTATATATATPYVPMFSTTPATPTTPDPAEAPTSPPPLLRLRRNLQRSIDEDDENEEDSSVHSFIGIMDSTTTLHCNKRVRRTYESGPPLIRELFQSLGEEDTLDASEGFMGLIRTTQVGFGGETQDAWQASDPPAADLDEEDRFVGLNNERSVDLDNEESVDLNDDDSAASYIAAPTMDLNKDNE